MYRSRTNLLVWLAVLALVALPAGAQQGPINPRIPPPPPVQPASPPAEQLPPAPEKPAPPQPVGALPTTPKFQPIEPKRIEPVAPRVVPATVVLAAGMRLSVVLDTPLSTRISRAGQQVVFRTEHAVPFAATRSPDVDTPDPIHVGADAGLELPPDTAFIGSVVRVQKPGSFGKQGEIRVQVIQLQLSTGQAATIDARLDSADPSYSWKGGSDRSRAANLINLALWSAQGTVLGANIHGGSGAAVGAGAGALVGLMILMSHHGADVYLEPGTPFEVVLEQPVVLPGAAVVAAEENHRNAQLAAAGGSSVASGTGTNTPGGNSAPATAGRPVAGSTSPTTTADDPSEPQLKRRPPPSQPQP